MIKKLIDGATSVLTSDPVGINPVRQYRGGAIPFQISGITTASVVLEGTISTEADIATAVWTPIANAVFVADVCDGLFVMFTHIRAKISNYTGGTITVTVDI